jgi:hypothetical protein
LSQKDSKLWKCVGRSGDKVIGHIYKFIFRDGSDSSQKPFPAVEPIPLGDLCDKSWWADSILQEFGYDAEKDPESAQWIIYMPNRKALLSKWEIYQEKKTFNPNSQTLEIMNSSGVEEDLKFMKCFIDGKGLLSKHGEFVHDHYAHIRKRILMLVQVDPSGQSLQFHQESLRPLYEVIGQALESHRHGQLVFEGIDIETQAKLLSRITAIGGALADVFAARSEFIPIGHLFYIRQEGEKLLSGVQWQNYFQERFKGDEITEMTMLDFAWPKFCNRFRVEYYLTGSPG